MAYDGNNYGRSWWGTNFPEHRGYRAGGGGYQGWGSIGGGYDRGYRTGGFRGGTGYDRGYQAGYDRDHKSQWQTDYGDPFGDRTRSTPFRMMRGPYEGRGYDAGMRRGYGAGDYGYANRSRYDRGWW